MEKIPEHNEDEEEYNYTKLGWSEERIKTEIEELRQHPLFCQDVSNLENQEEMLALRSLIYDGDKEDEGALAQTFYRQGNDIFKERLLPILKIKNPENLKDKEQRISIRGRPTISL